MTFHQDALQQLEAHFTHTQNEIVILYGDMQNAPNDTLRTFLKNKNVFHYQARCCSDKLQLQFFHDEIREELPKGMRMEMRYSEIISAMLSVSCEKRVIVIEEFQHFVKSDPSFMEELIRSIHNQWNNQKVMFLLTSSDKNWIEREMVTLLHDKAYEVRDVIALSEPDFSECRAYFSDYDFQTAVEAYAVFGPYPGNWMRLDRSLTLQENICRHVLTSGSYFHERGLRLLSKELREPAVYNTLLYALATGSNKLNELHKLTGFDRAKISVYLKNLIENSIVEKVESYDAPGHENMQKGVYRIIDQFTRFWFCFVFPHYSRLSEMDADKFYRKYIDAHLRTYAESAYVSVCREYLIKQSVSADQKEQFETTGAWHGKVGTIDIIATTKQEKTIAAFCNFEKSRMSYADLEWNRYCLKQAKITCEKIYLFSYASFEEKLKKEALSDPSLILIDGDLQ